MCCLYHIYDIIRNYCKRKQEERKERLMEQEEIISIISEAEPVECVY